MTGRADQPARGQLAGTRQITYLRKVLRQNVNASQQRLERSGRSLSRSLTRLLESALVLDQPDCQPDHLPHPGGTVQDCVGGKAV